MLTAFLFWAGVALLVWMVCAGDEFRREAATLNLRIVGSVDMAKIGDTVNAKIEPRTAPTADSPTGLPAPVFGAEYFASGGYEATTATDGLSAVLVAVAGGTGFTLTCTATSKHGVALTQTVPLPDVDVAVDDEAVTLNLAVA